MRQGKANVGLEALRRGSYCSVSARTFGDTLMALGEASEAFDGLYLAGEDTLATGTYGEARE